MSTDPQAAPRSLHRPNLRHLKDQAKDLVKAGTAKSITDAQFKVARLYGFLSWPKLKAHVESLEEVAQLKQAIDGNDVERVMTMMERNLTLHRAPIGYGKDGPLTWVAECRVPWESPTPTRLAMAKWMIENGSDVHQGGDGPLMRAALNGYRLPMIELLVSYGADVNAQWHGDFPIVFAPCESVDPVALKWLLDHGANPNCDNPQRKYPGTALDYVIGTYARSPERLSACIDLLLDAGGTTRYNAPGVLEVLRRQLDRLAEQLDADSTLVARGLSGRAPLHPAHYPPQKDRGFARDARLDVVRRMVLYESYPRDRRHGERRSPGCLSTGGNRSAVPRHDPQPGCGGFAATGRGGARGSHSSRDPGSLPARY